MTDEDLAALEPDDGVFANQPDDDFDHSDDDAPDIDVGVEHQAAIEELRAHVSALHAAVRFLAQHAGLSVDELHDRMLR